MKNLFFTFAILISVGFKVDYCHAENKNSSAISTMSNCLSLAKKKRHILDQENGLNECFSNAKIMESLTPRSCFQLVRSHIAKAKRFSDLSENFNASCFYQTSGFSSLDSCLADTNQFKIADTHDEAIFYCYQQFQNEINQQECFAISEKLRYPAKKNHLSAHCQDNP